MGRHSDIAVERSARRPGTGPGRAALRRPSAPVVPQRTAPAPRRYEPPASRRRAVLGFFAVVACMGIALVTVCDPYAGAKASPYYKTPVLMPAGKVQKFKIEGGYVLASAKRDSFKVVAAPVAPRPVPQAAGALGSHLAGGGGAAAPVPTSYTTPAGTAQAYAAELVSQRGWSPGEFTCLVNLWNRESGWNTHAYNPSGAYGIPQSLPGSKMSAFGADWQNDYRVQIQWGLSYVSGRYGSPCGAWGHSQGYGWY
jgi:hypothetical protein